MCHRCGKFPAYSVIDTYPYCEECTEIMRKLLPDKQPHYWDCKCEECA
jgi:hypothetical protein